MLPYNSGGHAAFQDTFVSQFLKFYPDPFVLPKSTWDYIVQFWYLDLSKTDSIMQECYSVFGPFPISTWDKIIARSPIQTSCPIFTS